MDQILSFFQKNRQTIALAFALSIGSYITAKLTSKALRLAVYGSVAKAQLVPNRLRGKVVILTGATGGLGANTAEQLINLGVSHLVLACRNVSKGEALRQQIAKGVGAALLSKMTVMKLDLADLSSVKSFVEEFKKMNLELDIIIENAGTVQQPEQLRKLLLSSLAAQQQANGQQQSQSQSIPRYEETFVTNVLGHVLLTELLMPVLRQSKREPAVVTLSSSGTRDFENCLEGKTQEESLKISRNLKIEDMALVEKLAHLPHGISMNNLFISGGLYTFSKRCNVWTTNARHKRYNASTGIRFNCLHPGFVDTGLPRLWAPWFLKPIAIVVGKVLACSPLEGVQCTLHVANQSATSGHFYDNCRIADDTLDEESSRADRADELYDFCLNELKQGGYL